MSSAIFPAGQAVEEAEFISSLMKSGDVFAERRNPFSKISNRPKRVDFDHAVNRESELFKSVEYTVPIFHPVDQTSKLNLLIEVTKNQVLQGVVICDLEFICDNIPVIRNKYKHMSLFSALRMFFRIHEKKNSRFRKTNISTTNREEKNRTSVPNRKRFQVTGFLGSKFRLQSKNRSFRVISQIFFFEV